MRPTELLGPKGNSQSCWTNLIAAPNFTLSEKYHSLPVLVNNLKIVIDSFQPLSLDSHFPGQFCRNYLLRPPGHPHLPPLVPSSPLPSPSPLLFALPSLTPKFPVHTRSPFSDDHSNLLLLGMSPDFCSPTPSPQQPDVSCPMEVNCITPCRTLPVDPLLFRTKPKPFPVKLSFH